MYLAILGRQPAISLAELTSLYAPHVRMLTPHVASIASEASIGRLGGTQKLVRPIGDFEGTSLQDALLAYQDALLNHLPQGKLAIGLSLYGRKVDNKELFRIGLTLKKALRSEARSVRIVPSQNGEIKAAQIIHNRMTTQGADIVLVVVGKSIRVGITEQVQDIEAYTKRDHGRPARDARVGMLPPKLAQIMINLANPAGGATVLDPFCGTGVVLQEAALMNFDAYGSDLESTLIEMSRTNLDFLGLAARLETGDARSHHWHPPVDAVVTEGYLGEPQTTTPSPDVIEALRTDARKLTLDFLRNLHDQIETGTPVCITLPAWRTKNGFARLGILDQIEALGYTVQVFSPITQEDLLYARDDQIVGRELVTLRST